MADALHCSRCGQSLAVLTQPLARRDECPKSHAQVHVCKRCTRLTTRIPKGCTEEDAPEVRDKKGANFCDYFKPNPAAFNPAEAAADAAARATLDSLFKK